MTCEIINNTPYPIRVKTSTEEKVLGVKESAIFWSASTFTVGIRVLTDSFSEKDKSATKSQRIRVRVNKLPRGYDFIAHVNRFLFSFAEKKLTDNYYIVLDSKYTFFNITEGERFFVRYSESECVEGEYVRVAELVRENGEEADGVTFSSREEDDSLRQFRASRKSSRRVGLVLVCLFALIAFALATAMIYISRYMYFVLREKNSGFYDFSPPHAILFGAVFGTLLGIFVLRDGIARYRELDFVDAFCEEESYLPRHEEDYGQNNANV